jgi:hypothetical protein
MLVPSRISQVPSRPIDDGSIYDLLWRRHALPTTALAQELGVFEYLADHPQTIETVAASLEIAPRAAEALMSVSAALGFLRPLANGAFETTELTRTYLLRSSAFFYGQLLPPDDPGLTELRSAVCHPASRDSRLAVNMESLPDDKRRWFIRRMHAISLPAATALAEQPVFRKVQKLLDVGGGSGSLSCALTANHSSMKCTLMDLPSVCDLARAFIEGYGLAERVALLQADMFKDPWPQGYDAVLFGNIFHDWDEDTCQFLAHRAFSALRPGGFIILHEMPLSEAKDGPLAVACFSVSMLLHEKGKQYTARELHDMLSRAGFIEFQSAPTFGYYHLVQAARP